MARSDGDTGPGDVLIVAHGHILRAFAMRWVNKPLEDGPTLILEAGGVGILRQVVSRSMFC
jgi:sedoheptulose-bisphosphatase